MDTLSPSRFVPSPTETDTVPVVSAVATEALAVPRRAAERLPAMAETAGFVVAFTVRLVPLRELSPVPFWMEMVLTPFSLAVAATP